ncbi:MAG TPA: hypothetical protein VJV78_09435 [Polyangiales bacterium]|nr:hypothetical protein [Polyangiales bacterium]
MTKYVSRSEMDAVSNEIYPLLPKQFRDRLPAEAKASAQNTEIFKATLHVMPSLVNVAFKQVKYKDGEDWLMWKLVAAFYLIEQRIGPNSVRQAGERIYSTMPWPPMVSSLADALRFTEIAYFESHLRGPKEVVGCWRVESEARGRTVLVDDTPYPCNVNEGVIAGICSAFSKQKPLYRIMDLPEAKRSGGLTTRYEVMFEPA